MQLQTRVSECFPQDIDQEDGILQEIGCSAQAFAMNTTHNTVEVQINLEESLCRAGNGGCLPKLFADQPNLLQQFKIVFNVPFGAPCQIDVEKTALLGALAQQGWVG